MKHEETIAAEPDALAEIRRLRPNVRRIRKNPDTIRERMAGAFLGRCIGCTLGVPVENFPVEEMERLAASAGTPFPPLQYWERVTDPERLQYNTCKRSEYARAGLDKVPVDDDITYTILNLLLLEEYGCDYAVADVGRLWRERLPFACTAEAEALRRLREGADPLEAAEGNDYVEWIGAAIRADAFGYVCAGDPEGAAMTSYADARLSHRKNGIYGEMFLAAAIAAAFVSRTPLDAVAAGLGEIPRGCALRTHLDWALSYRGKLSDYRQARALLDVRFPDMHCVHIHNNMCALVFALILGGNDFNAIVSNSIAIGLDNDCNGASVGSIAGACFGLSAIPAYWYAPFNDTVLTYIKGCERLSIRDVIERFLQLQAARQGRSTVYKEIV